MFEFGSVELGFVFSQYFTVTGRNKFNTRFFSRESKNTKIKQNIKLMQLIFGWGFEVTVQN